MRLAGCWFDLIQNGFLSLWDSWMVNLNFVLGFLASEFCLLNLSNLNVLDSEFVNTEN